MLLCYILLVLFICESEASYCEHIPPKLNKIEHNADISPMKRTRRRRSYGLDQLKILPYYDATFNKQKNAEQLKKVIVQRAIDYWQSALSVKGPSGRIHLRRKCGSDSVKVRKEKGISRMYCTEGCKERSTCGPSVIPSAHLGQCREYKDADYRLTGQAGAGVAAPYNYVLYISAKYEIERCSSGTTLGYAAHCQQEGALDRPVAGYINFCPGKLSLEFGHIAQSLFTAKHEILHALGFSVSLYAWFRHPDGSPRTKRSSVTGFPSLGYYDDSYKIFQWDSRTVKKISRQWLSARGSFKNEVSLFVTPKIVEETRRHFGCATAEGAELENQGFIGVKMTHWEKRVFENELMTPTFTQEDSVSRVTLAYLEDSGWYLPDYRKASDFTWGKDLGCEFLTSSCYQWMKNKKMRGLSVSPFCNIVAQRSNLFRTDCSASRDSMTFCNLQMHKMQLPPEYQYFTHIEGVSSRVLAWYGGSVALADYCPFLQEFNWKSSNSDQSVVRTSSCKTLQNNYDAERNSLLQQYGANSICVNHRGSWSMTRCGGNDYSQLATYGSGCYRYSCDAGSGLTIYVDGRAHLCEEKGQLLNIHEGSKHFIHKGKLVCPSCKDICPVCPSPNAKRVVTSYDPIETVRCSAVRCVHRWRDLFSVLVCLLTSYCVSLSIHSS